MGRSPCCDEIGLKKGPWTPEEDEKLVDHIKKHGQGSWRALPKLAGPNYNTSLSHTKKIKTEIGVQLFCSLQVLIDVARAVG
jgi:hypothetical protein